MENKTKLTLQCSPGTFQKVQNDMEYRNKVLQDAAGDSFFEEIEFSQCNVGTVENADNDFVPICTPVGTNEAPATDVGTSDLVDASSGAQSDAGGNPEEPLSFEPGCSSETPEKKMIWLDAPIRFLIARVKELRPKVGKSPKLRSKRRMWNQISDELREKGYLFNWTQVETKFFSLERQYKRAQLHNSKTGRCRQIFPYQIELDDLLQERVAINPDYLIDSESSSRGLGETADSAPATPENLDVTPSCSKKKGKSNFDLLWEKIETESQSQQKRDEEIKKVLQENLAHKRANEEKKMEIEKQKLNLLESLIGLIKK